MFSDRINRIDLIYFTGCGVRLEKRPDEAKKVQFRFSVRKSEESTMDALSLALLFVGAMMERLPSKMEAVFCLSAACPAEREKGKNILFIL